MITRRELRSPGGRDLVPVHVRRWLYGVALAALPLLVGYGILSDTTGPLWTALIGAVLVPGTALAHTPADRE